MWRALEKRPMERILAIDGGITAKDCLVRYKREGRVLAVASIYRDVESLMVEVTTEQYRAAE
jgi:hypothetical protein